MSADERANPAVVADGAATDGPLAEDARRILAEVRRILDEDRAGDVPDQAAQDLLLAAVRLFSAKRDLGIQLAAFPATPSRRRTSRSPPSR